MGALLVSLAAIILANTQYSEVSAGQCACWWWSTRPKRVCQWSLGRSYFLLEVFAPFS